MAGINGLTGTQMDVNSSNEGKVALTQNVTNAGFATLASEIDPGTVTGSRYQLQPEASDDYRLRVGVDNLEFQEVFAGSAVNTGNWVQATTVNGASVAVSAGFAVLTTGTTLNAHAVLKSRAHFQKVGTYPMYFECLMDFSQAPVSNCQIEWGFGIVDPTTTAAAPTDGVFFRQTSAGSFTCVMNPGGGGNEVSVTPAGGFNTRIGVSVVRHFTIGITENECEFWIDNVLVAQIPRATNYGGTTRGWSLPVFFRAYCPTAPSLTSVCRIGYVSVHTGDANNGITASYALAQSGMHGSQAPTGGTIGQTAQYSNSANPTAAAATNTTAALGSGLGGLFLQNAAASAATDLIISSYQNPAATNAAPGHTLFIRGVHISVVNTGAAVATTPTTQMYALAYGHTAVSLATAESSTAKAPRRIGGIGSVTFPVGAAVGAMPTNGDVHVTFAEPIPVLPGEFVQVIARCVAGTATASQVLQHSIGFNAIWK